MAARERADMARQDTLTNADASSVTSSSPSIKRGSSIRSTKSSMAESQSNHSPTNSFRETSAQASISQHRRNRSDVSQMSVISYAGSDSGQTDDPLNDITVFVDQLPKNLMCGLCARVFRDPVIAKCGHTFCRTCLLTISAGELCPIHRVALSRSGAITNLTVAEQIGELRIHCKYGCKNAHESTTRQSEEIRYVVDSAGCPEILVLAHRRDHELSCPFAPTECPNSHECGTLLKKDLDEHLQACVRFTCSHKVRGCKFVGSSASMTEHLTTCEFETTKAFLRCDDEQIVQLKLALELKDQEIHGLRTMVSRLTERLDRMESVFEMRIEGFDESVRHLSGEVSETMRNLSDLTTEVDAIQTKIGVVDDMEAMGSMYHMKCKGTFVGHQGPVWALAVHGDLVFSGSSDETIKVWNVSTNFSCQRTLNDHRGIIHALHVYNHRLYSGASDCIIHVWDIGSFELLESLEGHEHPVCTLAASNGLLFSGSLKVVKIWDSNTYEQKGELLGINHWVRALVATDKFLYAGSYQSISVWSSDRRTLTGSMQTPERISVVPTSGGSIYSLLATDRFIIAGTYENVIHVLDINTNELIKTLEGCTEPYFFSTAMSWILFSLPIPTLGCRACWNRVCPYYSECWKRSSVQCCIRQEHQGVVAGHIPAAPNAASTHQQRQCSCRAKGQAAVWCCR
eukprot:m.240002 g.240002  ORF g.240002 m.240002 type:complete len:684 (+) comp54393_c0_seq6:154-2205(+)